MGLYFRKSINLGGGFRLNFSKRGVGISGGVKGARISTGSSGTYMNLSIPGTGIGYRKRLSGSNTSSGKSSTTSARYPYQRTIANEYTGETKTIRAASQWELDEQVRNEEIRMQNNELRAKRNAAINSQKEKAADMTEQVKTIQAALGHIIADTISVNDRLDWDKQYRKDSYPEFSFNEAMPQKRKSGFFEGLLEKKDNYEEKLKAYEERKATAFREYFAKKQEFESEQRAHNADVEFLRENFELGEGSAVEKYASVILANSKYPDILEMDYDVNYIGNDKTIVVSFLLPPMGDFPMAEKYVYVQSTDRIKECPLTSQAAKKLYENTLLAVGIRTVHELFEAIYNGSVETVVFEGYLLSGAAPENVADFSDNVREIFKITADKEVFESIPISDSNIQTTLQQLNFKRVRDFSNPEETLQRR